MESLRDARDALEAQLADKEEQLKESHVAVQDATNKHDELDHQLNSLTEKNAQLQEQVDRISGEQHDSSTAQHTRVEELLAREREQGETISKLTQELEDYKHDCAGLWQHNEDLKQQLEAMTAGLLAKDQEVQMSALSGQSSLQDQVSELERQLELLQQQLDEKDQALSAVQWERNHTPSEVIRTDDSPSTDDDKYVMSMGVVRFQAQGLTCMLCCRYQSRREWESGAIRMLTDQVAAAQRELSDAMELNLHLNNRNTWLEEQYKLFTDGGGAASDEDGGAVLVPTGDALFANGNAQDEHEQLLSGQDEIVELHQVLQDREQKIMGLENSYAALAHEFEQLKALHSELVEVKQIDEGTMTQLTFDLNEATAYIGQLQEMNANLTREVEALKQQVDEAASAQHDASRHDEEQVRALESELSRLQNEHQSLSMQLETDHAAVNEKSQALEAAQRELSDLRAYNDAHTQESAQRLHALETELLSTKDALQEMQEEFAESESANLQLGIEAEEWKERFEAVTKDKEAAAQSIQQQLDQANATVEKLHSELAAAKEALVSAQAEKQQAEDGIAAKLERARHELASIAAEKQRFEEEVAGKLERMRHELSAVAAEKSQIEEEAARKVEHARHELAAIAAEKQASLDEMQQRHSQALEDAKRSYEQEKQTLEQQIQNLHDVSQENMQGSMELQERLEEVEEELVQCRLQLEASNAEREALKRTAEELERASREAQTVRGELEHLKQSIQQLSVVNDRLKQSNEELSQQLTAAQNERAHLESARAQAAAHAERAESSASDLQRANEELSATLDKSRGKISALEQQTERAGEDQRSAQSQLEALTKKNMSLVAEVERMREHMEAATAQTAAEKQRALHEIEELRRAQETGQEQQRALSTEVAKSREELRTVHALVAHTQSEKNALAQEAERLRTLCMEQQDARHSLEARSKELERALEDARRSVDALEEKLSRAEGFAVHLEEEAHMEIGRLHEVNSTLQAELEHALMARHDDADAHDELRMKLAELQAENNVLAARAHRLTEQLSQYTDLPDEDRLAASQTAAPDLWELLSSGMEQLKADLELASKYAASIDTNGLDVGGSTAGSVADGADGGDEALAIAS